MAYVLVNADNSVFIILAAGVQMSDFRAGSFYTIYTLHVRWQICSDLIELNKFS